MTLTADVFGPRPQPAAEIGDRKRESQVTAIVRLALEADVELWHTPTGDSYITIAVESHQEHHPLGSRATRDYLTRLYYRDSAKAPNATAMQAAVATLSGMARFDGAQRDVHIRVAGHDGSIYLDLCDPQWRAVEITSTGWRIITNPPVRLQRRRGMLALPLPVAGGSIAELRPFINVASDTDFCLMGTWQIQALRPRGPYPILILIAEQGAEKTTTAKVQRRLCDPSESDVHRPPRNREEEIFQAQRPIILNGISQVATRGDLLDRAIVITMPPIPDERRKDEATFWREFNLVRPRILGALLDAVSCGLRRLPDVQLERKPRMADFALWSVAAEPACPWPDGTFLEAYAANRQGAVEATLDGDPVADVVRTIARWSGTATELLALLNQRAPENLTKRKDWFSRPRQVSDALRRLAPGLRKVGIEVTFRRQAHTGRRLIFVEKSGSSLSPSPPSSPDPGFPTGPGDVHGGAQGDESPDPSPRSARISGIRDDGDDGDVVQPRLLLSCL